MAEPTYDVGHLVYAEESEAGEEPGSREQFFRRDEHVQETKAKVDKDGEEENGSSAYSEEEGTLKHFTSILIHLCLHLLRVFYHHCHP